METLNIQGETDQENLHYELKQNIPNCMLQSTWLGYDMSRSDDV